MDVRSKRFSRGNAVFLVLALAGTTLSAAGQSQAPPKDQSWTATSETSMANANPSRTTESYTKSGNRTVDRKNVEVLGPDGEYQPYVQIETETVVESPTATRSITRTYTPDPSGDEQLTRITESVTQNAADGTARTVETTSLPDLGGKLQVVGRAVTATTKGAASKDSQTTFYLPDINGGLAPVMQVNEQEAHGSPDQTSRKSKTTLLPDPNGNWQVYESEEQTARGDAESRTSEESVSRRDFEGNVSPVSQAVTQHTNGEGRATTTSETYSVDVPGWARDGSFRLLERSRSVRTVEPGETVTEQRIEQMGPDNAETGFATTVEKTDTVVTGSSGSSESIIITARYPDGYPSVVTVETRNSQKH